MQIIPTTELQKNFTDAEERIGLVGDNFGWIQVDVSDDIFTAGKTFELELLTKINIDSSRILWDIHLMVKEPIKWIEKCLFVEANRVIGQVELMNDRQEFVNKVKETGMEAGVAFDIGTKVDKIPEGVEVVLLMGRKAGFGEYPLDERIYEKIGRLVKVRGKEKYKIAIDGGVSLTNVDKLTEAGVDIIYTGKYFEKIHDYSHR